MTTHAEQTYQERILKVLLYIQNNLDSELSLEELSSIAFFSPFHFHRIFTAHTGESIKSYVRRLRLDRATRDLAYTDLSLMQISERAGYDTQQSFHRAFKEAYHDTPKHFRDHITEQMTTMSDHNDHKPPIEVKTIPPLKVAFVRHIGPYQEVLPAWQTLTSTVGLRHILSDHTKKISIPYDTPETTPAEKLHYDACVTLEGLENFKPTGKTGVQTLHSGKYAIIRHTGSLDTIEKTYRILFGVWLPESGYEPADFPNFMLHQNTPLTTPTELLVTDIYLPIK